SAAASARRTRFPWTPRCDQLPFTRRPHRKELHARRGAAGLARTFARESPGAAASEATHHRSAGKARCRGSQGQSSREERGAARRREASFKPAMTRLNLLLVVLLTACALCLVTSRSEEHTSELQSRFDLVCRLLLEKKKS